MVHWYCGLGTPHNPAFDDLLDHARAFAACIEFAT
jgi:hypothetical protein